MQMDLAAVALVFLALWYGPELALSRVAGWPRSYPAMLLRDLMLPLLFIAGCANRSVEWHGHHIGSTAAAPDLFRKWARRLRYTP